MHAWYIKSCQGYTLRPVASGRWEMGRSLFDKKFIKYQKKHPKTIVLQRPFFKRPPIVVQKK